MFQERDWRTLWRLDGFEGRGSEAPRNAQASATKASIAEKCAPPPGNREAQATISMISIPQDLDRPASTLQIPDPFAEMKRKTKQ